ncbi:hypothetical protein SDC9_127348 [bioreactor metagenome]|uniref:Uncharacterized protein n=1 Tax=bioreactor metagenome TaxID=1076179 RepID=A0A645CTR8_9ZZZZ
MDGAGGTVVTPAPIRVRARWASARTEVRTAPGPARAEPISTVPSSAAVAVVDKVVPSSFGVALGGFASGGLPQTLQ